MKNHIDNFLDTELDNENTYRAVLEFIISREIRKGEFECREYIVKKLDHFNFIIYKEYTSGPERKKQINNVNSIYVEDLIEAIQNKAEENGFIVIHQNQEFYYEKMPT